MDVHHIARLANLKLPPKQTEKFQSQFDETLSAIAAINKLDTKNTPPTSQVTGQVNITREDKVDTSRVLSQSEAISQAPKSHNGYIVVPHVFE
ncbi:MAG: Asp-tRNA(Asn)/Glu-tRNA(Gln) amidotransferase subunit GatC [Candidatus Chisholmbacteria bacterium]|nr:Asp-tRNA(Asn)/Glu-tRNA(Gln) amidotransferase subunit GatC [Candidatus Chisholmbacteria bacterium]